MEWSSTTVLVLEIVVTHQHEDMTRPAYKKMGDEEQSQVDPVIPDNLACYHPERELRLTKISRATCGPPTSMNLVKAYCYGPMRSCVICWENFTARN